MAKCFSVREISKKPKKFLPILRPPLEKDNGVMFFVQIGVGLKRFCLESANCEGLSALRVPEVQPLILALKGTTKISLLSPIQKSVRSLKYLTNDFNLNPLMRSIQSF
jgi:hypothetical protein